MGIKEEFGGFHSKTYSQLSRLLISYHATPKQKKKIDIKLNKQKYFLSLFSILIIVSAQSN